MQKTLAAATLAAVLGMGGAAYADGYTGGLKDAPVYAPVTSWTGFYIGVNGGYAWGGDGNLWAEAGYDCCWGDDYDEGRAKLNADGGFGGVQVGYNWQHGHFVLGVEADLQGAAIKGSKSFDLLWEDDASAHAQSKLDWFGTVRGRLGYAFDRTLVYFTGGFAFGEVKDTLNVSIWDDFGSDSKKGTRTGYVLGGGLEHKIDPSWSIKAEYQYIDLGSDKLAVEGGDGECSWASATFKADHSYNTVRVGLNYRLHQDYEPLK